MKKFNVFWNYEGHDSTYFTQVLAPNITFAETTFFEGQQDHDLVLEISEIKESEGE